MNALFLYEFLKNLYIFAPSKQLLITHIIKKHHLMKEIKKHGLSFVEMESNTDENESFNIAKMNSLTLYAISSWHITFKLNFYSYEERPF